MKISGTVISDNYLFLRQLERALEADDPVEDRGTFGGILVINAEIAVADELEALKRLCIFEFGLNQGIADRQGVGIEIEVAVLVINTLFFIDDIFIKAGSDFDCGVGVDPVDRDL